MTFAAAILLWALVLLLSVLASAVFSGLETGTYMLNKVRLDLRASGPDEQAKRLARVLARPQEMLTAILISNNTVNYLASMAVMSLFLLAGYKAGEVEWYSTAVITPILFVLGEVVPKNIFQSGAEATTYRLGWVLTGIVWICRWTGLSLLVSGFSKAVVRLWHARQGQEEPLAPSQRVRSILAEGHAHGVLTGYQSSLADRVIHIGATSTAQAMVPLHRVASIPRDCSAERFRQILAGHDFSRLPMWEGHPSKLVGVVNVYDVLYDDDPNCPPAKHLQKAIRIPAQRDVAAALVSLQRARQAMAVVEDRAGKAIGIVTMKDLVEEIVGELEEW